MKYSIIIRKQTGLLIAAKYNLKLLNTTCTSHENILTGRIYIKNTIIRLIAVYGLQETSPSEDRSDFFSDLGAEIENCLLHDDNLLVVGDFNAKIDSLNDKMISLSPNGSLMLDLINSYDLDVLNFHQECSGKWTRVKKKKDKIEKSVLDYVLCTKQMSNFVSAMEIDENHLFTPFSIRKSKNNTSQIFTDHNSILCNFKLTPTAVTKTKQNVPRALPKIGWKLSPDGLHKFYELSSNNSTIPNNYTELEQLISHTMDSCFKRKTSQKKTNPHHSIHNATLKVLLNSIFKPLLKAGRVEKQIAQEYISYLQKINLTQTQSDRANRVNQALSNLTVDSRFSVKNFHKLRKCISTKRDDKTSVVTDQGVEIFDDESIVNEYVKEFKQRLARKEINPSLKRYEELSCNLLNVCLNYASKSNVPDFIPKEVFAAIQEFQSGKSPDSSMFPPDVFKHAGQSLIDAITNILNGIKNSYDIPDSWVKVIIFTLYKNKGSRKHLKNQQGIFLTAILFKVMEKLIKNRLVHKPTAVLLIAHSSFEALLITQNT